jgi:single-stranded-DNA-specific exonuclease
MNDPDRGWIDRCRDSFRAALGGFDATRPLLILGHHDADGLSATALLARALRSAGHAVECRILGRGENAWSPDMATELADRDMGGLILADLGTRARLPRPGMPTIVLDHHVPTGRPEGALLLSGHELEPVPTTSLLAWWCAGAVADAEDLLWLAAIGLIGDMAEKSGFAELETARRRWGITALRNATALINAPRRASAGDATPALALLMKADGPKDILSGAHPETALLLAAREEVQQALAEGRRVAPRIQGEVALIALHSPCQIHPLVAQQWRSRLKDKIVIAANTGYRPGWVHFAARSDRNHDLIAFFRDHRPEGADPEQYGNGHAAASGGALPPEAWNRFLSGIGFGREAQVTA